MEEEKHKLLDPAIFLLLFYKVQEIFPLKVIMKV